MVFSSLTFLFLFFPALFFAYFVLARTRGQKNGVLLLFSIVFYGWGGVKLLGLIFMEPASCSPSCPQAFTGEEAPPVCC